MDYRRVNVISSARFFYALKSDLTFIVLVNALKKQRAIDISSNRSDCA